MLHKIHCLPRNQNLFQYTLTTRYYFFVFRRICFVRDILISWHIYIPNNETHEVLAVNWWNKDGNMQALCTHIIFNRYLTPSIGINSEILASSILDDKNLCQLHDIMGKSKTEKVAIINWDTHSVAMFFPFLEYDQTIDCPNKRISVSITILSSS